MKSKRPLMQLVAGLIIISPLFSLGQRIGMTKEKMSQMHHETMDDSYLPNAHNNKKTSPAYRYNNNVSAKLTNATTISTIQVNVDAGGQNILGDAANEPSMALNPANPKKIAIGWRQFDNVSNNFRQAGLGYSTDAGQHWTFPGVIQPGVFRSDPVLDYDLNGNFYYNSLTNTPDYFCKVFKSANDGVTWGTAVDAKGGDKQWMTIDHTTGAGSGNIYASWTPWYSTCMPDFFTRSTNGGSSFESCTSESTESYWKMPAVGNNGELYMAGSDTNGFMVVAKSLNAKTAASIINWNVPVNVFMDAGFSGFGGVNPQGLLGQANIDVDRSTGQGRDNVYVLATMARLSNFDPGDVMFARSIDGGLTWSMPVRINDDKDTTNTQWFGTMSVAPNGRIDVVWLDTRDNPGSDLSALYYSYSTDQGNSWSVNEKLSDFFDPHTGYPNQSKMGDYFDMISDSNGAHLAWSNTLNNEEDVYYSHIVPQIDTRTDDLTGNSTISVFPNPTKDQFTVYGLQFNVDERMELFNVLGESISKVNHQTVMDISSQPAGVYFLKIVSKDGRAIVKKIIKE